MYTYKDQVEVLPLAMVDDLVGIANCGHSSLALNTFINSQIELKKLKFHTPDAKGKSKCHVMHIGNDKGICPQLKVHGTDMQKVTQERYLGDILSSDGKCDLNVSSRVSKGLGIVTQIMNILEKVTLGSHYYETALLLRESIFLNGILTNVESWHGLSSAQIYQLESVDKLLLRKLLNTPVSTPTEAMYLELGVLSIGTILKARRLNFLHYLVTRSESEMVKRVFLLQWYRPVQGDWSLAARQDLREFGMDENLETIKCMSKDSFKNMIKRKAHEYEFSRLMKLKQKHSKLSDLSYSKLETQKYFKLDNMNTVGAQTLFKYRVRMANYGENFRGLAGPAVCPLCTNHLDNQKMGFENCKTLRDNVIISGDYMDIFCNDVPQNLVHTLQNIELFRDEYVKTN